MLTIDSYPMAVLCCVVTMLCWGSWANTQKLVRRHWPFQLFYWDYTIGVVLLSLLLAFTLGNSGSTGRHFLQDLAQADDKWLGSSFLGGAVFNLSNILLVAAIDIAGMAVAFPIGVGLALILGVITTYWATRTGNMSLIAAGVACITLAIVLDAIAYRRLAAASKQFPIRGVILAIVAGVLMGGFYGFVAQSMGTLDPATRTLESGKLSPYSAIALFSLGVFFSNFLWNSVVMIRPFRGEAVSYRSYFTHGTIGIHLVGVLGGVIWSVGMALSIIASTAAGAALSYGLGQGATMIGAVWGVFIWKEFKSAPPGTYWLLTFMFLFYAIGLAILISSKISLS